MNSSTRPPREPSYSATECYEYSKTGEAEEKDVKIIYMNVIEVFQQEMNKLLKEIQGKKIEGNVRKVERSCASNLTAPHKLLKRIRNQIEEELMTRRIKHRNEINKIETREQ